MTRTYYDADADVGVIAKETVAILGYGNQGRAQGLNLRDSGVSVIVGSVRDESWEKARQDAFDVYGMDEAAGRADIVMLLLPDEVQPEVYARDVQPHLREGKTLTFAHGYNIRYGLIRPPAGIDVILVAPRMIGINVRNSFLAGGGVPAYIAVAQDATGSARTRALALAKGIGATRAGVIECTFEQETDLDLFTEQGLWPFIMKVFHQAFDFLVEKGFSPEMVALEMYGSGEAAEIFRQMARVGFYRQLTLHSQTSQYGQLSRMERVDAELLRRLMQTAIDEIRDGRFSREWSAEQKGGYQRFESLRKKALAHPINETEENVRRLVAAARAKSGADA